MSGFDGGLSLSNIFLSVIGMICTKNIGGSCLMYIDVQGPKGCPDISPEFN
jgi:hypothetical protein